MTTKDLQEKNIERQTGEFQFDDEPVKLQPRRRLAAPVAPPAVSDEERVMIADERPDIIGRDLMGYQRTGNQNQLDDAIRAGYGQSRFDTRNPYEPDVDLEDARAREQTWGGKVLNGVAKGLVTTGTAFLNTTLGTLVGAFEMTPIGTFVRSREDAGKSLGERIESSYERAANNPASDFLINWQEMSEDIFPNYQTTEERSEEYQRNFLRPSHWITGNFIGDVFLKNFGFTAGAMLGGMTWGKLLGASSAAKFSNDAVKGIAVAADGDAEAASVMKTAGDAVRKGVVRANSSAVVNEVEKAARRSVLQPFGRQASIAVISALGEGNAEGLMARNEFLEDYLPDLERRYSQEIDGLEKGLLDVPSYRTKVFVPDGNGGYAEQYVLNERGQEALLNEQNRLFEKYQMMRQEAYNQADELATTTLTLNIPILTVSNLVQFSRMLGGGWRSARKTMGRVGGGLRFENGVPVANYRAMPTAIRAAAGIGKVAGSEAAEEMLQGTVSSGAKQVASDRMTYFNDIKYDPASINNFKEWLSSMAQGGRDYLGDVKNWQEGFLGALTGLLGIPGRGYFRGERGGVAEAISEARERGRESMAAADKLNQLVNSQEFRDRWNGYIRHNKFNDDINKAVGRDDEYAFHYADDAMLFSDVMDFAKAGRLDDLNAIADRFSNLSDEDIRDIREQLKQQNGAEPTELNSEIKERVQKQAEKIKAAIKNYSEIRDDMMARLPADASQEIIDETVFTAGQIRNFENRFLRMLDETITTVEPILATQIDKPQGGTEFRTELDALKNKYAKIFGGSLVSLDAATRKRDSAALDKLQDLVKGDKVLEQKVTDMRKLYRDRQKFYDKITKLETVSNEEFAKQAVTEEKVQQQANVAQAEADLASFKTMSDVRREYNRLRDANEETSDFIEKLENAKSTNKAAKDFLDLYNAFNDIRGKVSRKLGFPRPNQPEVILMNELLNRANTVDQLFNDPDTVMSYDDGDWGMTREDFDNGPRKLILDTINEVKVARGKIFGREEKKSQPENPATTPTAQTGGTDPAPEASVVPDSQQNTASISEDGKKGVDAQGREWTVGENGYAYDASKTNPQVVAFSVVRFGEDKDGNKIMIVNDGNRDRSIDLAKHANLIHKSAPEVKPAVVVEEEAKESETVETALDGATPEDLADNAVVGDVVTDKEQVAIDDKAGNNQTNYYQSAIPEISLDEAAQIRDDMQITNIDERRRALKAHTPKAFIEGHEGYHAVWDYLVSKDAFTNMVKHLDVNDKVGFMATPELPLFDGKPQIVMFVEKDGQRYILNVMRRPGTKTSGEYYNLDKFWRDFINDYNAHIAEHPNTEFIFGGESPITSRVWDKRFGIIDYDYNYNVNSGRYEEERSVIDVPGYDENAPIFWIDQDGRINYLRGERQGRERKINMGRHPDAWIKDHLGAMYYLAEDGTGSLVPIRLWLEHFRPDNMNRDTPTFNTIRTTLENIRGIAEDFFGKVSDVASKDERKKILDEHNKQMHEEFANLKGVLNVSHLFFSLVDGEYGPMLHVVTNWHGKEQDSRAQKNGFYMVPNDKVQSSASQRIENLVQRIAELGLSVDAKKGSQDKGAIPNFDELLAEGLITTNARKMLPKNVDFYIEPYDSREKGFVATSRQEALMKRETPAEAPVVTPVDSGTEEIEIDFNDDDTTEEMDLEEYAESSPETPEPIADDNHAAIKALMPDRSDEDVDAMIIVAKSGKAAIQSFDRFYGATGTKAVESFRDVFNAAIAPSERDEVKAALQRLPHGDNLLELFYWANGVMLNTGAAPTGNDIISTVVRRVCNMTGESDLLNSVSVLVQPSSEPYEMLGTVPDMSKFDNLPNQVQADLIAEGFSKEEYEMLNDEARDNALECVGV